MFIVLLFTGVTVHRKEKKKIIIVASRDQQWNMDTEETSYLSSHTVRKFTTDNKCSIDIDPYGFTVRDYHTRQTLLHCDSTGDLYPLHVAASAFALLTNNHSFWHQRLGHPSDATKYATEILEQAQMLNCNHCRTPIDTEKKLGPEGSPITDPTLYRSHVQQLCLYMHDPREPHLNAMKLVLRYLRGTNDLGLQLFRSTTSQLIAYSDADWAGCPATRRSTCGYCVFLGDNLLTWSSRRQDTLSRSSAKAEYRGVANVVAETFWIRNISVPNI
nr:ribonuclease H-like domain-containing protein [Tanacetum cinerariifolium]